jgi:hypothetical protein
MTDAEALVVFGITSRYISAEDEIRQLRSRVLDLLIQLRRARTELGVARRRVREIEHMTGLAGQ